MTLLAHLVQTGVGPFYDGAAHFFLAFESALAVIAVALFAGLRGTRSARAALVALAVGWLAGGVAGFAGGLTVAGGSPLVAASLLLFLGLLAATDRDLPRWSIATLAALTGLTLGATDGAAMASGPGVRGMLGGLIAAAVVATLVAALASRLQTGWPRIVARVAGSWLAALGLLTLGWAIRVR